MAKNEELDRLGNIVVNDFLNYCTPLQKRYLMMSTILFDESPKRATELEVLKKQLHENMKAEENEHREQSKQEGFDLTEAELKILRHYAIVDLRSDTLISYLKKQKEAIHESDDDDELTSRDMVASLKRNI